MFRSTPPAVALLLVLAAPLAPAQGLLPAPPTAPTAAAPADAPPPPGAPALPTSAADKRFFQLACAYNAFTVASGEEAERATDPELRAFAKTLATDRDGLCDRLRPLARAHGVVPPQGLDRQRDALLLDLKDRASGPKFDKAFASRTLKTQREIVRLYEKAAREDTGPDVRRFAEDTLPLLRRHLATAERLDARLEGN